MDPGVFTAVSKGDPLPLASLRLLVPPLQLMAASMWQVLKKQDIMNYWKVAEFVSLVMDMVPELLMYKHRTHLNLGLRARYILELCRSEQPVEPDFILSHLENIKPRHPTLVDMKESEDEIAVNFLELIQTLLKDPEVRQDFFLEVFPAEYGPQYDSDLQTLFSEFFFRLAQLLPVPDLEQTVSWLGAECSVLEDCVHSVSEPSDLKYLLQHHKQLGHLEQHVPPSSMGDSILSSLSAVPPSRVAKSTEHPDQSDPMQGLSDETHTVSFVDDVAVEIITVTDYAEVELGASTDIEVVTGEICFEGTDAVAEDSLVVLPDETTTEEEVGGAGEEATREEAASCLPNIDLPEVNKDDLASTGQKMSVGPHDCPDCEKKFKFASSLIAHRVIHTGERPHRCNDCGRCFSFRQSLDRHRHTHKTGRKYDCVICGETFHSLSARTEHKQTHVEDGVYVCHQCNKKFNWEQALARHVKTHTNNPTDSHKDWQEVVIGDENVSEAPVALAEPDSQVQANDSGGHDPENAEVPSSGRPTSEPEAPELHNEDISLVKVRTSGRKRKPTMKIQVINLQKRMTTKRRKEVTETNPPELKPFPYNCAEHSYGSSTVSSKDINESSGADGSSAAFSCPKCSFHHPEEAQVQQHIDKVHSVKTEDAKLSLQPLTDEEGRFSCPDCEKTFKFLSLLTAHQRIHTGEQPFLCSQCGRRFSFKQSLERHKQTHKSGRKYECLICGEFFKSLVAQREHKSTHMENGEYLCSECGRAFAWKSALVRHLKTHSEDADKVERSYKCPRCDLGFSCASYLHRHLQTHQEERVHTCNCGKSFAYRAALTAHQRIHQKERPHICTQCGKGFLYKGGLLSHMKIHSEEMPFMCSFCGKSFKRERNMKKHERCHTRENVFSCSQCDKSFVYKATLIRHELTHSGERPYLCSDCGKGFFSHAELLKHERFHTGHKPFQCPQCGKKFTQSCYLTIHLRYHTGVRPYSCPDCDKSFLSANRLKRHQRTHSGEKPYLCVECGKGFRQSYNLKMHQRTHIMKLT
ncbi:zinc finger and SCAN domain-containing protein 2-like isoform X2 [Micropterus salmoides]|uniref:zinc finger and SCAN domain-containing protein 2-like isoform X2 n=1 Tax=Micropterus salmoides TaxID=27706 RepID=UPI0018EA7D97|nr:zinc finger and SCAN domain-containing protein 2-like isoform X2 [Micropterus salmoides]